MKFRKALPLVLLPILGVVALSKILESTYYMELTPMPDYPINQGQPRIPAPHEDVDNWKIPAIVQLSDEQRIYVSEVVAAMIRVMAESSTLEVEEGKILGTGKFRWPKNPDEPIKTSKSYFGENFRMAGVAAGFERKSEGAPWTRAGLTVHPRNFPVGVYLMGLQSALFNDFELKKVIQEDRQEERIKMPVVFYFSHKKITNLTLRVEARGDVASVKDPLPSSFHMIVITRG